MWFDLLNRCGIRSDSRLGQAKRSVHLARRHLRQIFGLLLWSSEQQNTLESDTLMGTEADAKTQIVGADNLTHSRVSCVGGAHTAIVLGHLECHRSQIPQCVSRDLVDASVVVVFGRIVNVLK